MYSTLNFFITATVNLLRISENNAKDMNIVPSYVNTCVEMLENDLHRKCTFDFIPKRPTPFQIFKHHWSGICDGAKHMVQN